MWGTGDFSGQNVILDIFRMFGLFLLAQVALQSIFVMVGFITRQTGGAVATNLAITIAVPTIIVKFIDFACSSWFKIQDFSASEYWVSDYLDNFQSLSVKQDVINKGLIVCVCYIAAATAIGIYTFYKRDIK
jgi:ABC-type transport system involved in multi-copper enzyme maturation permease subunit